MAVQSELFETVLKAEIGNGNVYTPTYNASDRINFRGEGWNNSPGAGWEDIHSKKVTPSKRNLITKVVNELTPKEREKLDKFIPNPVDISIDLESGEADVTFPNGNVKTVNV